MKIVYQTECGRCQRTFSYQVGVDYDRGVQMDRFDPMWCPPCRERQRARQERRHTGWFAKWWFAIDRMWTLLRKAMRMRRALRTEIDGLEAKGKTLVSEAAVLRRNLETTKSNERRVDHALNVANQNLKTLNQRLKQRHLSATKQLASLLEHLAKNPTGVSDICIGGPMHGEHRAEAGRQLTAQGLLDDPSHEFAVPVRVPSESDVLTVPARADRNDITLLMKNHYQRTRLVVSGEKLYVWLHEAFTPDDFNQALRCVRWPVHG